MDKEIKATSIVQLKRELGLFSAVNMILGVMIGSGIFISPAGALHHSGSVGMCIIIWVVSGIISLLGALAFAELGTVVPRSGAEYAYFMDAFGGLHKFWGKMPAFICSWIYVIALRPAEVAVLTLTFSEYVCQPIFERVGMNNCEQKYYVKKLVALITLGLISHINATSVKLYVRVQNFFSLFKVLACLVVVAGGMYEIFAGNLSNLESGFKGTKFDLKSITLAFYSGLWAYDGWNSITTVTEEVKHPEKNILKSIVISLPIVTGLYVFMNISYMTVLSIPEIVNAPAVAELFATRVLGSLRFVIPLGVAIATFGCALSLQFGVTRLCYVAAQDGHMLEVLSYIHFRKLTPVSAVVLQSLLSAIFISIGNIVELIEFASFLVWIGYGTAMIALLVLRKTMNNVDRPYKVPICIPLFIILVALFLSITPIVMDPSPKYIFALTFLVIGGVIYHWYVYKRNKINVLGRMSFFVQVLLEVVPPSSQIQ